MGNRYRRFLEWGVKNTWDLYVFEIIERISEGGPKLTMYTILCAGRLIDPTPAAAEPHSTPTPLLSPPQVKATTLNLSPAGTISLMTNCVKHWAAQSHALATSIGGLLLIAMSQAETCWIGNRCTFLFFGFHNLCIDVGAFIGFQSENHTDGVSNWNSFPNRRKIGTCIPRKDMQGFYRVQIGKLEPVLIINPRILRWLYSTWSVFPKKVWPAQIAAYPSKTRCE